MNIIYSCICVDTIFALFQLLSFILLQSQHKMEIEKRVEVRVVEDRSVLHRQQSDLLHDMRKQQNELKAMVMQKQREKRRVIVVCNSFLLM